MSPPRGGPFSPRLAIHDHGWGDGELFAEYRCQPGVPVDFYEDGSKNNVLISLRETKNRGDVLELWIERVIRNGLLQKQEWFETEIDQLMRTSRLREAGLAGKGDTAVVPTARADVAGVAAVGIAAQDQALDNLADGSCFATAKQFLAERGIAVGALPQQAAT